MNSIPLGDTDVGGARRPLRAVPAARRARRARASLPEDLPPDELTPEKVEELLSAPSGDRELGTDRGRPRDHRQVRPLRPVRHRRREVGVAVQVDVAGHGHPRRGRAAADACRAALGELDGEEVTAQNGRYGPYIKKGTDSRSLDVRGAAVHGHPRRGAGAVRPAEARAAGGRRLRRRCASWAPTRSRGKPMVIKDGRFGPYVTDGETNASLRRGDAVEEITDERAAELLADRRARGPAKRKARRRRPAKKAPPRRPRQEGGGEEGLRPARLTTASADRRSARRRRQQVRRSPRPAPVRSCFPSCPAGGWRWGVSRPAASRRVARSSAGCTGG